MTLDRHGCVFVIGDHAERDTRPLRFSPSRLIVRRRPVLTGAGRVTVDCRGDGNKFWELFDQWAAASLETMCTDQVEGPPAKKVNSRPLWNRAGPLVLLSHWTNDRRQVLGRVGDALVSVVAVRPIDEVLLLVTTHGAQTSGSTRVARSSHPYSLNMLNCVGAGGFSISQECGPSFLFR